MSFVIATETLIETLETLAATAGKESTNEGVFIYSTRGAYGEEPGETDLIAGLSTNGVVSGHCYAPAEGGNLTPTFWPLSAVTLVASAFAERAAEAEDHVLRISQEVDDRVVVFEHDAPPDGVEIRFNALPAADFPHAGVVRLLTGTSPGQSAIGKAEDEMDIPDVEAEMWEPAALGVLLRLAKKKRGRLLLTRSVTNGPVSASVVGLESWAGVITPPTPKKAEEMTVVVETRLDFTAPTPVESQGQPGV